MRGYSISVALSSGSVLCLSVLADQDAEVQQAAHHPYTCVGNEYTPPLTRL
jgi:hypothetical protein